MLADHGLVGKCVSLQWVPVESIGTKALLDLAERQAEGEAGSMQGALCGTRSGVSRITPWAEGGAKLLSHPGIPDLSHS